MDLHYEISPNWKEHFEGKIFSPDELYRENVLSTMGYLKLRKIKRLIEENQKDMNKSQPPEELKLQMETHQHLKELEKKLVHLLGTVILK